MNQHKTTITRLSIGGFKSFADDVSLDILPGLTGIVGPNGCGKSNIVESLRWVMGETSARALRGGESDDLIFAGTRARPARNLAKVTLHLNQTQGLAPTPFQKADSLEIARQAERGTGSTYCINNKTMRARDVQTIFADLASGTRSSSIISQNRVGQLVNAKPEERRLLLEEAAGITGLHVRRHDAEIKLRQAEANLERAETCRQQLAKHLKSLEDQSIQARNYRELSSSIRHHEALLLSIQHARAASGVQQNREALQKSSQHAEEITHALEEALVQRNNLIKREQAQEKTLNTYRPLLEEKRLQIELAHNNLRHIRKACKEHDTVLQQLENDLRHQENMCSQLTTERNEILHNIAQLQKDLKNKQAQYPVLQQDLRHYTQEYAREKTLLEHLRTQHHQKALKREALRSRHDALAQRLSADQQILEKLEEELTHLTQHYQEHTAQKPNAIQCQKLQHALRQAEQAYQQALIQTQEQRLQAELAAHTLKEGKTFTARLTRRQTELEQQLSALKKRHEQEAEQQIKQHALLLSDEARKQLEATLQNTAHALITAQEHEKATLHQCEKAEKLWLTTHTQNQEIQQRRHLVQEEQKRLANTLAEQKKRYFSAKKNCQKTTEEQPDKTAIIAGHAAVEHLEQEIITLKAALQQHKKAHETALLAEQKTHDNVLANEATLLRRQGEYEGLKQSLSGTTQQFPSLLDQITLPPDLTKALASALTEGLEATLLSDDNQLPEGVTRGWRPLAFPEEKKDTKEAPTELMTLSHYIQAPPALQPVLRTIFLVEDESEGYIRQKTLSQGQAIVHRNGTLWRWDGFIRHAKAPSSEAIKLEQRQRLQNLTPLLAKSRKLLTQARENHQKAQRHATETQHCYQTARKRHDKKEQALLTAQRNLKEQLQNAAFHQERHTLAKQHQETQKQEYHLLLERSKTLKVELEQLPDLNSLPQDQEKNAQHARTALNQARLQSQSCQQKHHEAQHHYERALLHHRTASARLDDLHASHTHLVNEENRLTTQRLTLQNEAETLDLSTLEKKHQQAQNALQNARKTSDTLGLAFQEARTTAEEVLQQAEHHQRNETLLFSQRDTLIQRHATQKKALEYLLKEAQDTAQMLDTLPPASLLEKQIQQAEQDFQKTQRHVNNIRQQLAECEQEERILHNQNTTLTQQAESQGNALQHAQQTCQALKERLLVLQKNSTEKSPAQLEEILQQEIFQLERLDRKNEEAQSILAALQEERATIEARHDRYQALAHQSREEVIRLTERLEQAEQAWAKLRHDTPLPEEAPIPQNNSAQTENTIRRDINRMIHQRESLGTVNLCAEEEFQKTQEESERLAKEYHDLTAAIARLRSGINAINRESRKRLMATFTEINGHFQKLFTRMFGGGTAHLSMIGNDDPLESGLEIFTQPPGKKLTAVSLLSGGEQALTALSLIFSAFHCNPAPVCVLDEVDAPLDDANVERFCTLLTDIAQQTGTRFLIVTHHHLTMAHMNRLFGVTMQERGVSRILSVNLAESIDIVNG